MSDRRRVGGVWRVPRDWPGETVVCLGGGPSLTPDDVDYCRGRARVIAINDAYRLAPWADVLYGCDGKWWDWHDGVPGFHGRKVSTTKNAMAWPDVWQLELTTVDGLESDPACLAHGRSSGYQAVGLAVHFGAARIILLGYDMQRTGGKSHWFGEHPDGVHPPTGLLLQAWPSIVAPLEALGVEVINCTRETALTVFPCRPLREVLA